jgi:hypothetical protein
MSAKNHGVDIFVKGDNEKAEVISGNMLSGFGCFI